MYHKTKPNQTKPNQTKNQKHSNKPESLSVQKYFGDWNKFKILNIDWIKTGIGTKAAIRNSSYLHSWNMAIIGVGWRKLKNWT